MESAGNKREIARRALLGEEVASLESEIENAPPPLLSGFTKRDTHEDISPLSFDDLEEAESRRGVTAEEISPKRANELFTLQTYEHDAAKVLKESKKPLIKLQADEIAAQKDFRIPEHHSIYEKKVITIGAIVVIIVVLLTLGVLFFIQTYNTATVQSTLVPGIITPNTQITLSLARTNRSDLIGAVSQVRKETRGETDIADVRLETLTGGEITGGELLLLMETEAPGSLKRALSGKVMLGVYGTDTFIIFRTNAFEQAFAGFLEWETTLAQDMGHLFVDTPQRNAFSDTIVANRSVRTSNIGEKSLMYSFISRDTIIMTSNERSFRDISNILFSTNVVQ